MRIAVTGASGCVGSALLERWVKEGKASEIKAIFRVRNEATERWKRQGVEIIFGDLRDEPALRALASECDVLVHCAGLTKESEGLKKLNQVNVTGTETLARVCLEQKVPHFIFLSSAAVYGEDPGDYSEERPLAFDGLESHYSRTKFRAEENLRELFKNQNAILTILRPTVIVGLKASWVWDPLKAIAKGIPLSPREESWEGDFISLSDMVDVIFLAMKKAKGAVNVYNISGFKIGWKNYYQMLGGLLGKKAKCLPPFFDFLTRIVPSLRLYKKILSNSRTYPIDAAKKELGFEPRVGILEMREELERELKQSPSALKIFRPQFKTRVDSKTFIQFSPQIILRPRSEKEIQEVVHFALKTGRKIRVRGATHSFSPLYETQDILLDLRSYRGVIDLKENTVRVLGGTSLYELMNHLSGKGKSLATHGAIKTQTVSGAISTGTHGCASQHGSLSSKVIELKLIDGQGRFQIFKKGDPALSFAQISLGCLGIITEVVLEIEDTIYVEETAQTGDLKSFLEKNRVGDYFRKFEYALLLIYPRLGSYAPTVYHRTHRPPRTLYRKRHVFSFEIVIGKIVLKLLAGPGIINQVARKLARFKILYSKTKRVQGELAGILATEKTPHSKEYPAWDVALAIPSQYADESLAKVIEFLNPKKTGLKPYHSYIAPMFQLRPQARDYTALGASGTTDIVWFEIWVDQRLEIKEWDNFVRDLHELLAPFEYRVHWGKNGPRVKSHLEKVYLALPGFRQQIEQLDPNGIFQSPHLKFLTEKESV